MLTTNQKRALRSAAAAIQKLPGLGKDISKDQKGRQDVIGFLAARRGLQIFPSTSFFATLYFVKDEYGLEVEQVDALLRANDSTHSPKQRRDRVVRAINRLVG